LTAFSATGTCILFRQKHARSRALYRGNGLGQFRCIFVANLRRKVHFSAHQRQLDGSLRQVQATQTVVASVLSAGERLGARASIGGVRAARRAATGVDARLAKLVRVMCFDGQDVHQ